MPDTKKPNTSHGSLSIRQPVYELHPSSSDQDWAADQLCIAPRPPLQVPETALNMLFDAARGHTGGSQAARSFLFWLAGRPDPAGYEGIGGLELRRMDRAHKAAALEIIAWWAGPTQSDRPLYALLSRLVLENTPDSGRIKSGDFPSSR